MTISTIEHYIQTINLFKALAPDKPRGAPGQVTVDAGATLLAPPVCDQ